MPIPNKRSVAKMHVKKGDDVVVIAGKDKGVRGKILSASPKKGTVIVEGVNMVTRHVKPRNQTQQGGRIEQEGPIFVSNVMLYCDKCKKPVRAAHKIDGDKKTRVCPKCGAEL